MYNNSPLSFLDQVWNMVRASLRLVDDYRALCVSVEGVFVWLRLRRSDCRAGASLSEPLPLPQIPKYPDVAHYSF